MAVGLALSIGPAVILFFFNESARDEKSEPLISKVRHVRCGHLVPYFILTADIVTGVGSGMTVKFFPLFFKNETGLTPSFVSAISACTYLLMIAMTFVFQKVSDCCGRVQASLLSGACGIPLLVLMARLKTNWTNWMVIVPIYIVRTAVMNSTSGIRKAVMMDFVPKNARGR